MGHDERPEEIEQRVANEPAERDRFAILLDDEQSLFDVVPAFEVAVRVIERAPEGAPELFLGPRECPPSKRQHHLEIGGRVLT